MNRVNTSEIVIVLISGCPCNVAILTLYGRLGRKGLNIFNDLARNKLLMLRVLKELTGRGVNPLHSFGDDGDVLSLRRRHSVQTSTGSQDTGKTEGAVDGGEGDEEEEGWSFYMIWMKCRNYNYIIPHYSPFKSVWDWITLLLVIYTAVCTPYMAAFMLNGKSSPDNTTGSDYTEKPPITLISLLWAGGGDLAILNLIDKMVDIMFIADMLINFRTTYLHNGEVVDNPRKIAINYMKGWFIIDAMAAIPFDLLLAHTGTSDTMTMTGVLKTARLLRLLRVARRIDQYSEYGAAVLILQLAGFTLVAHWGACLFYFITNLERPSLHAPISWLDKLASVQRTPYHKGVIESGPDVRSRYVTALYFTFTILTSVGFGNVAPVTNTEKIFTIVAMLIGSLMSAAIFGNVSSIMLRLYQGTEEYHEMLTSIKEFVKFHFIPKPLATRLLESYQNTCSYTKGLDMNGVLKGFPECLQADICLHLNRNLLSSCRAFKAASPGCLRALSTKFRSTHAPPGDTLIHPGDILDSIYFIARGTIEIVKEDDIFMAILSRDDVFGEDIKKWYFDEETTLGKSNYSVRAMSYCDLHKITIADLQDIMDSYAEFAGDFLKNFQLTFNLRQDAKPSPATPTENSKVQTFVDSRRRRSYFPEQSRQQSVETRRRSGAEMMTYMCHHSPRGHDRAMMTHRGSVYNAFSFVEDDDQASSMIELSPQLSAVIHDNNRYPVTTAANGHTSLGGEEGKGARCERRSWQAYARLKKQNTGGAPRQLSSRQRSAGGSSEDAQISPVPSECVISVVEVRDDESCDEDNPRVVIRNGKILLTSGDSTTNQYVTDLTAQPCFNNTAERVATSSPAGKNSAESSVEKSKVDISRTFQTEDRGGMDVLTQHFTGSGGVIQSHSSGVLSTILSGPSSVTYAPKSSMSSADFQSPIESDYRSVDPSNLQYLLDIDDRLHLLNQRMGIFENSLYTTVDAILELLGSEPSVVRS